MSQIFYKYQGAGNDFILADNRDSHVREEGGILYGPDWQVKISDICDRRYGVGADGLMLLDACDEYDFRMTYFNSDGSGGMMCGNGGRCIVAFAADMGISHFDFVAADGFHTAQIVRTDGHVKTVRLKMKDVTEIVRHDSLAGVDVPSDGWFLDTGTRHFVRFVEGLDEYDIVPEGRNIRYKASDLQPIGANVNYVESFNEGIKVRTYEKGVEDETFACGTGIVASCVASYLYGLKPTRSLSDGRACYDVRAKRDGLSVDFIPSTDARTFSDVWLTGPATRVAEILLPDM